jgi:hypothetical protein
MLRRIVYMLVVGGALTWIASSFRADAQRVPPPTGSTDGGVKRDGGTQPDQSGVGH